MTVIITQIKKYEADSTPQSVLQYRPVPTAISLHSGAGHRTLEPHFPGGSANLMSVFTYKLMGMKS